MIGQIISHYKILEQLGHGSMGVVYRAEDTKLKRSVAMKFLSPELTRDPAAKERFIREARAASALDHPNICTVHEIDETSDGRIFMVMSYYQGETLDKKILRGAMRLEKAVEVAQNIARGLAKAHSKGVVHRDIKPANIFITEDDHVKLFDFGLAMLKGEKSLDDLNTVAGTALYMSPEQVQGGEVDARSDIWSLGVILYEMIAGERPFTGDYLQALEYSIVNEEPDSLKRKRPGIPMELESATTRALAKDPRQRYQRIEEFLADLERARQELESPARSRLPIAVVSFENQTGSADYDYLRRAIPNLLITNLERSPYLRVVTWERLRDLLKQLDKGNAEIIDRELGFELCRLEGIDTIVLGSVTRAGKMFATDVKILDVRTKKLLGSAGSKGRGVDSILTKQIDELSREIIRNVGVGEDGEEEKSIVEVTTSSMEAYRYFLRGRDSYEKLYNEEARRFLKQAIDLDPDFAVAHLYLAWTHDRLRDTGERNKSFEMAKALSDRATKKERLYIEAAYARTIEQDADKRFHILREIVREYPREKRAHHRLASHYRGRRQFYQAVEEYKKVLELDPNYGWALNELAYMYTDVEDFDQAAEYFQRYAAISPGDANPIDSMGELYFRMGQLDQAIGKYEQALQMKPDFYYAYWEIAYLYALKEEYSETRKWIDRYIDRAPSVGIRAEGARWKSFYQYWWGDIDGALLEAQRLEDMARDSGSEFWAVEASRMRGWIHFDRGDLELSRSQFQHCVEAIQKAPEEFLSPTASYSPEVNEQIAILKATYAFPLSLVDLIEGDFDSARRRLTDIESSIPQYASILHAEILLAEGSAEKAVAIAEKSPPWRIPYMSDTPRMLVYNLPFLKDVLARAYRAAGQPDKAISEYQRLALFRPESRDRRLIHPLCHYQLARLYEDHGQVEKALDQYDKVLRIWEDMKANIPEIGDARERITTLAMGS